MGLFRDGPGLVKLTDTDANGITRRRQGSAMCIYDREYYRREGPSFLEAISRWGLVCK